MKPKVLGKSRFFRLEMRKKRFSKGYYYRIVWNNYGPPQANDRQDIYAFLDPEGSNKRKEGRDGYYWDYRNRPRAEQYFTILCLRWN